MYDVSKTPQCSAMYEKNGEEYEMMLILNRENELVEREENFRREMMNLQIEAFKSFTQSIHSLVSSLIHKPQAPTINIIIDKEANPESIEKIISGVNQIINNQ